jgi:guanylate cyclase
MPAVWVWILEQLSKWSRNEARSGPFNAHEQLVVLSTLLFIPVGFAWGLVYFWFGEPGSALIPFTYSALLSVAFSYFLIFRKGPFFTWLHPGLVLLLPFFLQLALGGFVYSSAVILWSFLSPLVALILLGPKAARRWFIAFLSILVLVGFLDGVVQRVNAIPPNVQLVLFVFNLAGVLGIAFILLMIFTTQLHLARERADALLLNILPEKIAGILKDRVQVIAEEFPQASVLFADLVNFTPLSEQFPPEEVVILLNDLFSRFDALAEIYGVEKIRTIGDNYMAASGVPTPRADHAHALADMALDMIVVLHEFARQSKYPIQFRIGMNAGPLVAGVIGKKKFHYDVWGDAVNIASRMESQGTPGKIQVAEGMHQLLEKDFLFEPRGTIAIKGKGEMPTWYLLRRR